MTTPSDSVLLLNTGKNSLEFAVRSTLSPEQRHQLVVDGNAGDAVIGSGWGSSRGTVTNGAHANVCNQRLYAQLLIDQLVTQPTVPSSTC